MNPHRTNGFIDLNGIPYLIGEYIDRTRFQMVDRGMIQDGIYIDAHEPMRAIVDVRIDDIGKKNPEGDPNAQSNTVKVNEFLEAVRNAALRGKMELPVLGNVLIAQVNYQLEKHGSGQVIRSMVEDIIIDHRSNFLDISNTDTESQVILSNFCNTAVSSINKFTVAQNTMQLRITNIKFYYVLLQPNELVPPTRKLYPTSYEDAYCGPFDTLYQYHEAAQSQHYLGTDGDLSNQCVVPPDWCFFNYLYHFEDDGKHIELHTQQIHDPRINKIKIPCGSVTVNRCFLVNPGERIIFKFSVWKNDMCIMSDTSPVAKLLRAPIFNDPHHPGCGDVCDRCYDHCIDRHGMMMDFKQNAVINQLNSTVTELSNKVTELENKIDGSGDGSTDEPGEIIPELPEKPLDPTNPIKTLFAMVKELSEKVDQLMKEDSTESTPGNYDIRS